jgi:biopolymer transport protein ExbD
VRISSMLTTKSNSRCLTIILPPLLIAASVVLISLTACAQRESDLKIVDLQGDPIIRIDSGGSVFDDIDRKVAVINDREGTFTLLREHQTIAFKNDPAVQRDNDRYIVKLGGESNIFEVKSDGAVLFNDKPWARVFGYTNGDAQKNRFMAAIVIIPLLKHDIIVALPRQVKNADHDPAIRRQPKISIPNDDEVYVGDERIPKADFDSKLGEKIDESLKAQSEANRIVNIASSIVVEWGTIVNVIASAQEKRVDRIGLIVNGDNGAENRFLLQIPPLRDPYEDISKLKPNPLLLGVTLSTDLQVKLITGGREDLLLGQSEAKGTLSDTSSLSQSLARIFQQRKELHVYKPGMETRTDLPEDERVEKTVVIKAYRGCRYADVIKLIDVVKGAGANPIILQLIDLP